VAQPLRRQIVFLNLAILVPLVAILTWSARETYREQLEQLAQETRALAGAVVVYLERGLDVKALQTVIQEIPLPEGAVITVTDDQSTVLARSVSPERYVGRRVEESPLPAARVPALAQRTGVDGVERVWANDAYPGWPALVSVGIPTAVAWDRVAPIFRRNLGIAAGLALFTIVLQVVFLRGYMHAFDRAKVFAARVASGDLSPVRSMKMPSREMEEVQRSVVVMIDRMREARENIAAQMAEERRMRLALESLQQQVIRQERLAAIGVLVSGVAHELNNPLQAILGFAELLQMRGDLPPEVNQELALIQKESARASAIIRNLSRFTRQHNAQAAPVRLRDVISSVVELRQRRLERAGIGLHVAQSGDPIVMAVFAELQQVVLNFVINGEQVVLQHLPPHRIEMRVFERDRRGCLEVQDSGGGVPPEHEAKLFQPFFTTKPVGEGTGLGLSVSYGIIQSLGGTIGYRRAAEGGAIFFFELPLIAETTSA
jgi:C4-dicarboxylate-specific signal transduction histidine kinase